MSVEKLFNPPMDQRHRNLKVQIFIKFRIYFVRITQNFFKIRKYAAYFSQRASLCALSPCPYFPLSPRFRCYADKCRRETEPKKFRLDRGPYLSQLDYQSRLQFQAPALRLPLTSIICTIGPSCIQPEVLLALIHAGMRVVRLDFSQGTHDCHCQAIQAARKAISMYVEETGLPRSLAIALDTKGQDLPADLAALTEQDKLDLKFGADQKVDMIFASFIRDARAPKEIRQALGPSSEHMKIISKIESQQGLANIDEIIRESDGIMVALGNMASEIPLEAVPLAQKSIVAKCNKVGKPVICANQMMNSMITKPRPTRAESSDVANAIFDGCDALVLSDETARGKYPVQCVQCMARICTKVESILWYESLQNNLKREVRINAADHISAVTTAIAEAATVGQAQAIVVASPCSIVPRMVSHMRPPCPIVMLTGCPHEAAQSVLFRGVFPLLVKEMVYGSLNYCRIMQSGLKVLAKLDILEPGQKGTLVLVNAMSLDKLTFRLFTFVQPTEAEREEERCRKLARKQRCKEMSISKSCSNLQISKPEISMKPKEMEECPTPERTSKCLQLEKQSEQKRSEDLPISVEKENICSRKECPRKDDLTLKCLQLKKERQAQTEAEMKKLKKAEDGRKNNKAAKDSLSLKKEGDNALRCSKLKNGSPKKDKCRVVKIPGTSEEKDNYSPKKESLRKNKRTSNLEKSENKQAEYASTNPEELEKSWDIVLENCKTVKLQNCMTVKLENCKITNLKNCKTIKLENCKQPSRHRKTTDRTKKV
ncbi:uncharacterized protein Dere_GG21066 [Drosophila erecta]|nr:uncharacterized protein Dere_GG21066 [Drosophila erecta]